MINKRNKVYIEIIRIIAIYFVIFNHSEGFLLFWTRRDSAFSYVYLFLTILCKTAVPSFFMISGALLIPKEESIKDLYKKRISKFIITLLAISLVFSIHNNIFMGAPLSLKDYFVQTYSTKPTESLWFIYAYIGVLISLPVLRKLALSLSEKDYIYWFICHIVFVGIIPVVQYRISGGTIKISKEIVPVLLTETSIFYFMMGHYIENIADIDVVKAKDIALGWIFSILAIISSAYMTLYAYLISAEFNQSFTQCLIAIPTCTLYLTIKKLVTLHPAKQIVSNIIVFIGSCTWGVYLFEVFIRAKLTPVFYSEMTQNMPPMTLCLMFVFACLMTGTVFVGILKQIPVIKKFL